MSASRPFRVGVLQHGQRLTSHLFIIDEQSHRVRTRRLQRTAAATEGPSRPRESLRPGIGNQSEYSGFVRSRISVGPSPVRSHHTRLKPALLVPSRVVTSSPALSSNAELHCAGALAQPIGERGLALRVFAVGPVAEHGRGLGHRAEAVGVARPEQVRGRRRHLVGQLLHRTQVVQDPVAAPVRSDHQVVEVLLLEDPVVRCRRQARHEALPTVAFVIADVERALGSQIEQPRAHRVLQQIPRVVDGIVVDAVGNRRPALPEVVGAVGARPRSRPPGGARW